MANITFILPCYPWGPVGGFRVVYEYANNLVNDGNNVSIIHPRYLRNVQKPQNLNSKLRKKLLYCKELIFKPDIEWQFVDKRVKLIFIREPVSKIIPNGDVIFATSWETAEYVNEYPASKGEKFYLIQGYETFSGPKERVENTWKFPFKKIFISKWLYKKGLKMGIPSEEMIYIPNGINHDKYKLINNIEGRDTRITMLYNSSLSKGALYGIDALKISKKRYPHLKAVLFGVSPRPTSLPSWIEYVQNPNQTELVAEIYNKSSIFLCSSLAEGWGLPGAEAMSCGCALISTDTGGVTDYAIDKENALLSKPKDLNGMVENISLVLDNEELRVSLAINGYENIKQFDWGISKNKLKDFMGVS